ncbi:CDGSH iron-sulfur domain-containing protein 3, mitochondrial-like [Artemia franciscana]|uniref:CDGSH iron-sulfur domain-containing protein 3, mitochondrial-like n=1 Tax=Artemia franciscana TaxID=6661 RepID=UPI0032DA4C33
MKMSLLRRIISCSAKHARYTSDTAKKQPILKNIELPVKNAMEPLISEHLQQEKGRIYSSKPFQMKCIEGKKYYWCSCGWSKNQPLCDGSHKNPHYKAKLKPVLFTIEKTQDVWLCNCKHTGHRPFCDGTCETEEFKAKVK